MLWYWDNLEETLPTHIVDCKVENCSFGCFVSHDGGSCEFKAGLNCASNVPVCQGNCVFDTTLKNCTDKKSPGINCEVPHNCDDENCHLDIETMTCSDAFCTATSCFDPSNCIPNRASCTDRRIGGSTAGGAYPSTLDIGNLSFLLGGNGGGGGDGLSFGLQNSFFKMVDTNEVFHPATKRTYNFKGYPINILAITKILKKNGTSRTVSYEIDINTTLVGQCLFFYEDMAETDYELNIAIDIHWKIWATVLGYCNSFYELRKSETFPRLYNTYFEDFFQPIEQNWKFPADTEYLKIILSDFNSAKSQKWLDTCLESAYHVSNSSTFRPPRPLSIGNDDSLQSNYFLRVSDNIRAQFHHIDLSVQNQTIQCP